MNDFLHNARFNLPPGENRGSANPLEPILRSFGGPEAIRPSRTQGSRAGQRRKSRGSRPPDFKPAA
jgi:hypothetical protein